MPRPTFPQNYATWYEWECDGSRAREEDRLDVYARRGGYAQFPPAKDPDGPVHIPRSSFVVMPNVDGVMVSYACTNARDMALAERVAEADRAPGGQLVEALAKRFRAHADLAAGGQVVEAVAKRHRAQSPVYSPSPSPPSSPREN